MSKQQSTQHSARNMPARDEVDQETSDALWDMLGGRTVSDDAPDLCEALDYSIGLDLNW